MLHRQKLVDERSFCHTYKKIKVSRKFCPEAIFTLAWHVRHVTGDQEQFQQTCDEKEQQIPSIRKRTRADRTDHYTRIQPSTALQSRNCITEQK